MAHMPINHPLRPLYRIVSAVCGVAMLVGGVFAFGQDGVLGIRLNGAGTVVALTLGAASIAGAVLGGNAGRWIHLVAGIGLLVLGMASLALLRSDANLLGFSMTTCIVSFLLGLALLTCGLYEQVGPAERQEVEEQFRHGQVADPDAHPLGADTVPKAKV